MKLIKNEKKNHLIKFPKIDMDKIPKINIDFLMKRKLQSFLK